MFWEAALFAFLAGSSALAGALLGCVNRIKPDWIGLESRHGIMAFGGGALLAAVCLVLVPYSMEHQHEWYAISGFFCGGLVFMVIDRYLNKQGSSLSQLIALMLDFAPEAIVIGAVITTDYTKAIFLAVIIAAQNFPEGFNAYREIMHKGDSGFVRKHILVTMGVIAFTGPIFAGLGFYLFEVQSVSLSLLMSFCGGGIFYLVFRDIAPQAQLKAHWLPSFAAVLGFIVGMIGDALV